MGVNERAGKAGGGAAMYAISSGKTMQVAGLAQRKAG